MVIFLFFTHRTLCFKCLMNKNSFFVHERFAYFYLCFRCVLLSEEIVVQFLSGQHIGCICVTYTEGPQFRFKGIGPLLACFVLDRMLLWRLDCDGGSCPLAGAARWPPHPPSVAELSEAVRVPHEAIVLWVPVSWVLEHCWCNRL